MSLKRYLLICYLISLAMLVLTVLAWATTDSEVPWVGLLIMSPVFALANVVVNILPWANMVRPDRRTSFWSYRGTNIFLGFLGVLSLLTIILAVMSLVGL